MLAGDARCAVEIAGAEIAHKGVGIGVEPELDTREVRQRPRRAEGRRRRRERAGDDAGRGARAGGLARTISPAGTSEADVGVRSVTANGPEPDGWRPPTGRRRAVRSARPQAGGPGAIGWVRACRNPPSGVLSVNRTWRGPVVATVTSDHEVADGPV